MSRANLLCFSSCLLLSSACGGGDDAASTQAPPGATEAAPPATTPEPAPSEAATPAATPGGMESVAVDQLAPAPSSMGAPEAPSSNTPPPQGSAGCGQPPPATGAQTLTVNGAQRTFLLDLPAGYDPDVAYPLVFGFHGATTSAMFFRSPRYGNLLSAMGAEAIVVHADALGDPTAWNNQADVPFFDAMLDTLEQSLCIDEAKIFATGHSSGGFFTNTLGCQRGDVLRGIAPVSGGGPFGGANCSGEVAVFLAHGENDMTVPFTTGVTSRDGWIRRNGCSTTTVAAAPSECVDYTDCQAGLPVRWCVHQDGHNWADFAPAGMWDFFQALPPG